MTVYNREKFITQAIESILASTYHNWELIICDDQSKDNSVNIAKEFEKQDKRIHVYINDKNLGDYPNRNRAASYAKGKYLKYVDADDMIYPYGLEQLVYYMEQFPDAGYGLCSLEQDKKEKFPFELSPQQAYFRHYFEHQLFHKAPLSSIINRKVFNDIGGFTGKRMLGDFEFWHILSQQYPVVLMPHGIVWYREHNEQEMKLYRTDPKESFKYLLVSKKMLSSQKCPLHHDEIEKALHNNKQKISRAILSAGKHHSISKAYELKRASNYSLYQILNYFNS